MKRLIVLFIPIFVLTVGCGSKKENDFLKYAKVYYENHMRFVSGVDSVTITLDDLKNASTEDDFDLSKIKKCDDTSKVTLFLDKNTSEIKSEEIDLKC